MDEGVMGAVGDGVHGVDGDVRVRGGVWVD